MTADIPDDPVDRTPEQQARWILANVIDWHRREEKAVWWEYFRLADLSAEDLLDEPCGLSGLSFVGEVGGTVCAPVHRYCFPPQETELRGGEDLRNALPMPALLYRPAPLLLQPIAEQLMAPGQSGDTSRCHCRYRPSY
jgi:hypothetical protein